MIRPVIFLARPDALTTADLGQDSDFGTIVNGGDEAGAEDVAVDGQAEAFAQAVAVLEAIA